MPKTHVNIKLSVIIPTHMIEGIRKIEAMNLPEIPGVEYIVSWQQHSNAPVPQNIARRSDIKVCRFDQPGLSKNRNNALYHANGEVCLNGDDDLIYTSGQIKQVIDTFHKNPDLEFALFRYSSPYTKSYPSEITPINSLPRFQSVTTFEMAFRRKVSFYDPPLRFNEYFGPGAPYLTAGEDDMFLFAARRMNLSGYFFPITITHHANIPTGRRAITDNGVLRTNGAIIALCHNITFPPRIVVNAWRIKKRGRAPFFKALFLMFQGAFYALSIPEIRNYMKPVNNQKSKP